MANVRFSTKEVVRAKFYDKDHPVARIRDGSNFNAKFKEELPFRVRFTNITVPGYGPNNPPGIGVAVIGFNNYIL